MLSLIDILRTRVIVCFLEDDSSIIIIFFPRFVNVWISHTSIIYKVFFCYWSQWFLIDEVSNLFEYRFHESWLIPQRPVEFFDECRDGRAEGCLVKTQQLEFCFRIFYNSINPFRHLMYLHEKCLSSNRRPVSNKSLRLLVF